MAGKLRAGFGEIKKSVEKQKQGFTPPTGKLNYFSLDPGEIVYVRFLDDFPITAKFYEWIINNQGKTSEFICAPDLYKYDPDWQGTDWVQKWTSVEPGIGWTKAYKSDKLILPKQTERTVGIAVLREPARDDSGNVIPNQFQDVLESLDVDNEQHTALHFMLVRQALSNFWDQMVGYHGLYGTIMDRDYRIERKGGDQKTTYQAIPMNPDPDFDYTGGNPDEGIPPLGAQKLQAYYGYGVKLKKGDNDDVTVETPDLPAYKDQSYTWENRYLFCGTTASEWCERRASEDFAEYWLNPHAEHLKDKAGAGGGAAVTAEQLQQTRPADPRAATAAPTPAAAPPAAVAAPVAQPVATETASAAPAEPITGNRFEQMRAEMAQRKAEASK